MTGPSAVPSLAALPPIERPGAALPLAVLALALLVAGPRPGRGRLTALAHVIAAPGAPPVLRPGWAVAGGLAVAAMTWLVVGGIGGAVTGVLIGACLAVGALRVAARGPRQIRDPAGLAGAWELLAVCLEVGLPVPAAAEAASVRLAGQPGVALRRVAGLLELGADPAGAWRAVEVVPALADFGRVARRSAGTGAGLAQAARAEAVRLRAELVDAAEARAQRAAVLITGPLGLCFLPAFLALGIAPVVIGLAGQALARW
ncbi:MAG: type II secretion system F family protein [Pseudonocardia sp.]|nr:type II secretion system F family protein [Pseudonocardia sp.]